MPNLNLRTLCSEYAKKSARSRLVVTSPQEIVMGALLSPPPTAKHRLEDDLVVGIGMSVSSVGGVKRKLEGCGSSSEGGTGDERCAVDGGGTVVSAKRPCAIF